jgi:hypothetical protein
VDANARSFVQPKAAGGYGMKWPAWLWLSSSLMLLTLVLLLAPPGFEGPTLTRLDPRHAITGMDLVALVPLVACLWVAINGLLDRPKPTIVNAASLPLWTFLAGLALGLAAAVRFSFLVVHWPLAVGMLLVVVIAALFAAASR